MVLNGSLTEINMKDNLDRVKFKAKELYFTLMEINIQDNL